MLTLTIDGDEVTVTGTERGNATHRAILPRPWVWSRRAGGYVLPRSLTPMTRDLRVGQVRAACEAHGVALDVDDTGARMSEAQRREARDARLEIAADRHERAAEAAEAESDARYAAYRQIADHIPLGQPILVGHHSERGHRADIRRMDNHIAKMGEAMRVAEVRAARAENLRRHLERGDSAVTIGNRIKRDEAEIRRLSRMLDRHYLSVRAHAVGRMIDDYRFRELGSVDLDRYRAERARLAEAVRLDRAAIAAMAESGAVKVYSRETIAKGDAIRVGGTWYRVARVNTKSVSVATGYGWNDTVDYHKIRDHRPAAELATT